jgi:hypothetical protein
MPQLPTFAIFANSKGNTSISSVQSEFPKGKSGVDAALKAFKN